MRGLLLLLPLALVGCGKDENSPEMGAVAPKPNPAITSNAPASAGASAKPGALAQPR